MPTEVSPSLEREFLTQLPLIERVIAFVARRHHLSAADAEDFASHVKLKLIEDDYAVFRKFQNRSSLRTFLTAVITRCFLDYRNSEWGKWRPSAEAVRQGPVATLLERLLARDGHSFEEACEILTVKHRAGIPRAELEQLAASLPVRVRRRFETDAALENMPSIERAADHAVIDADRERQADRVRQVLKRLWAQVPVQDRLLLSLAFHDGRKVADIARLLRLEQKSLYRRIDGLLKRLRSALEAEGISASMVPQLSEDDR